MRIYGGAEVENCIGLTSKASQLTYVVVLNFELSALYVPCTNKKTVSAGSGDAR